MSRDWPSMSQQELQSILEHPPSFVEAEFALCELGDRIRLREVEEIPRELHDVVLEHLNAPDAVVQLEAAILLSELNEAQAIPTLVNATKSKGQRLEALRALGKIDDPRARDALEQWSKPFFVHWADKLQAAAGLAQHQDEEAIDYLIKRTQSRRSLERCSALEFLGETRHEAALKILMPHLSDPTRPEWLSAARGLAMHRSSEAQKVLKSALKSVDAELRESVMSWLSERHLTLSMD